jgi:hypothetical protein
MRRKFTLILFCLLLIAAVGCSKHSSASVLIVDIPKGFNGNFVLEMGNRSAAPLSREGDAYVVEVPRTGKVVTSTSVQKPQVTFRNATDGSVWGFSESGFTTGDGISVGGKIEFFVGTRKEYEAEESKKNHSGASEPGIEYMTAGV